MTMKIEREPITIETELLFFYYRIKITLLPAITMHISNLHLSLQHGVVCEIFVNNKK